MPGLPKQSAYDCPLILEQQKRKQEMGDKGFKNRVKRIAMNFEARLLTWRRPEEMRCQMAL